MYGGAGAVEDVHLPAPVILFVYELPEVLEVVLLLGLSDYPRQRLGSFLGVFELQLQVADLLPIVAANVEGGDVRILLQVHEMPQDLLVLGVELFPQSTH